MELFDYDGQGASADPRQEVVEPAIWRLTEEQWDSVRRFAAERRYVDGARILSAGAQVDALHIVLSGSVSLTGPQGSAPLVVGPGGLFGLAAFLDGGPSAVGATAASASNLLLLTRDGLDQLASWTPPIALALLRDVGGFAAQRLRAAGVSA